MSSDGLKRYKECTASSRSENSNYLWIGKHEPVTSSTIARWLRTCLQEAGIDTNTFKAHSVRGAACSTAAWSGVTTSMQQTGLVKPLSNIFIIKNYRTKQLLVPLFCQLLILQTYMLIWKLSLPKCNLRMAQGMQCLQTICNYMRNVKLKYQYVHSLHICVSYLCAPVSCSP